MATTFSHNGNDYEIINDTEVRLTRLSSSFSDNDFIPKYAMYRGQRYTVTEIGRPGSWTFYEYVNVNAGDKRKKEDWKYVEKGSYGRASVFFQDKAYPTYSDLTPEIPITQLVIPDTVKIIRDCAFCKCKNLVSLTIPDSVTTIRNRAFEGCTSLKSLIIPDSVTSIESSAFAFACGLESLRLSSNVKRLSSSLFGWRGYYQWYRQEIGADQRNPTSIKIEIPSIVEEIGREAFDVFQNAEIIIYNEPGEVMIAADAFLDQAKIKYVGKKTKAAAKKESEPKSKPEQSEQATAPTIDLDKLINAVVADGVVTEKERSVILKKAGAAGYDVDEVEILLDGKLAEKQTKTEPKPEKKESKKDVDTEAKTQKAEKEVAADAKTQKVDIVAVDTDAMWADVVSKLEDVKIKASHSKGKAYMIVASPTHKKSAPVWYCARYSTRAKLAYVCIETNGGEAVRDAIMAIVETSPKGHVCRLAKMEQGARSKEKWELTIATPIDKPTSELVKWYTEMMTELYGLFEAAEPIVAK